MIRTILIAVCVVSLTFSPLTVSAATGDEATLRAQIAMLSREVTRLLSLTTPSGTPVGYTPLTQAQMEEILALGIDHLKHAQEENGHFRYEYVPYEDTYRADDNIVRQAGAFYQLGEVVRLGVADTEALEDTLLRSAEYFESLSRSATFGGESFRCIVERHSGVVCKLGATSLALIGLLDFVEAYPEHKKEYAPLIEDYASYILAMKKDDAGLRNYFHVNGGRIRDEESSFSNGEALLALVRYYQYDESPEVKAVIDDVYAYLSSPQVPFDTALYLWMMAALKDMDLLWDKAEYRTYAKAYTDWRTRDFASRRNTTHNMCAYTEGVVSAYILLRDGLPPSDNARLRDEITYWMWKGSLLQLTGADMMRLTGTSMSPLPNPERALGGFLTGHDTPTQRIDFTQHCLSTYAQTLAEIN